MIELEIVKKQKRGEKGKTETIVTQAVRNATNVRNRQKKARDNGFEYVEQIIAANNLDKNKIKDSSLYDFIFFKYLVNIYRIHCPNSDNCYY